MIKITKDEILKLLKQAELEEKKDIKKALDMYYEEIVDKQPDVNAYKALGYCLLKRAKKEEKEAELLKKKEAELLEKKEAELLEKKEAELLEKKEAELLKIKEDIKEAFSKALGTLEEAKQLLEDMVTYSMGLKNMDEL
uniref:Uncharacterized protein n=1 Tax=Acrobeloides nanus TaxID=290746 RepID=A0A914DWL1_9BILA